jgi:tRNA-2-methylthio-N6-dimethylallyladenosine synthase
MRVVEASRFSSAFSFQYSPRPGTPAATMADQLPKEVVQERFERLLALQERIGTEEAEKQVGRTLEVLVAEGSGRKDGARHRLSGRAADNRLVHFGLPDGAPAGSATYLADTDLTQAPTSLDDPRLSDVVPAGVPRPGDMVTVTVTKAAPHHLIADPAGARPLVVRRTRSGDAWAAREKARLGGAEDEHSHGTPAPSGPVSLGLPTLRR